MRIFEVSPPNVMGKPRVLRTLLTYQETAIIFKRSYHKDFILLICRKLNRDQAQ